MKYNDLLGKMPPHESPEFITFIRNNNRLVFEDDIWIVIENFKYNRIRRPWYVAFAKTQNYNAFILDVKYGDWKWIKNPPDIRTINRFHFHIYRDPIPLADLFFAYYCRFLEATRARLISRFIP